MVMPEMDGAQVAEIIMSDGLTEKIPIVFLTSNVSNEEIPLDGILCGFSFVTKPPNMSKLITCIEEKIGSGR